MKLKSQDGARILEENGLGTIPDLDIGTDQKLMDCLEDTAIEDWNERLLALKARIDQAREDAARLLAPKAVTVRPTPATLSSRAEVEAYISKLREQLLVWVDERPVIIP